MQGRSTSAAAYGAAAHFDERAAEVGGYEADADFHAALLFQPDFALGDRGSEGVGILTGLHAQYQACCTAGSSSRSLSSLS